MSSAANSGEGVRNCTGMTIRSPRRTVVVSQIGEIARQQEGIACAFHSYFM
jgi:hypothetical protein